MTGDFDKIHQLSHGIWIIQANRPVICWVTNEYIDEGELAIGITHGEDNTRVVSVPAIPDFIEGAIDYQEVGFLSSVKNKEGIVCDSMCSVCGNEAEEDEEVVLISNIISGEIDPWIHTSCCSELENVLIDSIEEHYPEIVGSSI